jgi:uncharacterized protein YaaR (DUF327 family)
MIEMEKTSRDKQNFKVKGKKTKKTQQEGINVVQSRFYDELQFAQTEKLDLEFDKLVDAITEQGKRFYRNPTQELLKIYKSMVKDFLEYVTEHMFQIEHYTGGRMKQKIYTVAKIIDEKLQALTQLVLSQQAQNIELLSTLDEIRGLLIDLYK